MIKELTDLKKPTINTDVYYQRMRDVPYLLNNLSKFLDNVRERPTMFKKISEVCKG